MFQKYVFPRKKDISLTLIVKAFSTIMGILIPTILKYIVDDAVPNKDRNLILILGGSMVLASALEWYFAIKANRMAARVSSETIQEIRQDLFSRSISLSARQIDKLGISSIESRLTSDTYTVHNFLGTAMRMGTRSVMLFFGGILFCVLLDLRLSLIILALILPIFLTIRLIYNRTKPMWQNLQKLIDEMVQVIRESIKGIKVSKALNKVEGEKTKFYNANDNVRQQQIKATDTIALTSPIVNTFLYAGLAGVIVYGGVMVKGGEIQPGVIMAFMSYLMQIVQSLFMINWMFNIYSRAITSMNRIEEVIFMPKDENQIVENPTELPLASADIPEVEFKNVSFSYDMEDYSLKNISFKIYPGQSFGIMGATGAGKSTVVRLLLRQYDVDEGEILVRGINIKNIKHSDLNSLFGSVFQKDFLFKGTIKENIDFGREIPDAELQDATLSAQAAEFIEEKEKNIDHELASKGVNLSGGQKQRVLLSRAFAGNPEILILDDSSSALDFKTESKLRSAIENNFDGVTSIIVAQRISSVLDSEQIMYLENGEILEIGNHEHMIKHCEPYREIAEMQIGQKGQVM